MFTRHRGQAPRHALHAPEAACWSSRSTELKIWPLPRHVDRGRRCSGSVVLLIAYPYAIYPAAAGAVNRAARARARTRRMPRSSRPSRVILPVHNEARRIEAKIAQPARARLSAATSCSAGDRRRLHRRHAGRARAAAGGAVVETVRWRSAPARPRRSTRASSARRGEIVVFTDAGIMLERAVAARAGRRISPIRRSAAFPARTTSKAAATEGLYGRARTAAAARGGAAAFDRRRQRLLLRAARATLPAVQCRHGAGFPLGARHRRARGIARARGARGARRDDGDVEPARRVHAQGAHLPARHHRAVRQRRRC